MAALLSCFSCHFSIFIWLDQSYILFLLPTFARLCFFVAHYLLLGVAVKKQIFSISQITDIEQYFAFVFMHATETSTYTS